MPTAIRAAIRALALAVVLVAVTARPAPAQTSWGVAVTPAGDVYFCDAQRNRVSRLDRQGVLSVVLDATHCRALALAADGFLYGESVNAGTRIDASSGTARDYTLGVWRVSPAGILQWIEPPTPTPDPAIWVAVDRLGRSYGWNGALPRSPLSQIVRRDEVGQSAPLAGEAWGHADGSGPAARFGRVAGLALAPDGTLVVADSGGIRRVTETGAVRTESVGTVSDPADGLIGRFGLWDRTIGVATDASGSAVVVDAPARRVALVERNGQARELWRSRWGWRPAGVALTTAGLYVLEERPLPALVADLIGSPRITLVRADGSTRRIVSVASWSVRLLAALTLIIMLSALRPRGRQRATIDPGL